MRSDNLHNDRIGKINRNNKGSLMEVVEYNYTNDVIVKFLEHGNLHKTTWRLFLNGQVKNPFQKTVYGVGYLGEGEYISRGKGSKISPQYKTWNSMLQRCYDDKYHIKRPTYIGCIVCEEWLNFQNFAKWYDENYYEIDGQRMHLDKDILIKGNKLYSPDTCVFTPLVINTLFTKSGILRGEFPLGVSFNKNYQKYEVRCRNSKGKCEFLGLYENPEVGFKIYKEFKEKIIKQIAIDYKNKIPVNLYSALMNYVVEITD